MKIWSGLVIGAGIALLALTLITPADAGLISAAVLIAGGSIAMSIACLGPRRQSGTEKKTEE